MIETYAQENELTANSNAVLSFAQHLRRNNRRGVEDEDRFALLPASCSRTNGDVPTMNITICVSSNLKTKVAGRHEREPLPQASIKLPLRTNQK